MYKKEVTSRKLEFDQPEDNEEAEEPSKSINKTNRNTEEQEEAASKTSNKRMASPESMTSTTKKLFQQIWCKDDEVVILKGIIEFTTKNGWFNKPAFYTFMKDSSMIQHDFSKAQLSDKLTRLHKRFNNVLSNKSKPTNPHDKQLFQLSKKIWADDTVLPGPNAEAEDVLMEALRESGLSERLARRGLKLLPRDKKAMLESKWMKFHFSQLAEKSKFKTRLCTAISNALPSGHL